MELQALYRFAPNSVLTAIHTAAEPVKVAEVRRVRARPNAIKKLKAKDAVALIQNIGDPAMLNAVVASGDTRKATLIAVVQHPLWPRAQALVRPVDPELAHSLHLDRPRLVAEAVVRKDRHNGLVGWVLALPDHEKADAIALVLSTWMEMGGNRTSAPLPDPFTSLALEVVIGRVPGLDPASMRQLFRDLGRADVTINYDRALSELHSLDVFCVSMLLDECLALPYDTVDRLTDDVVRHLKGVPTQLPMLVKRGYVSDSDEIARLCDGMAGAQLRAVLQASRDTRVAEAVIPRLRYGGGAPSLPAMYAIDEIPNLSTEARLIVLSNANHTELRHFLLGRAVNVPRPGEGTLLARAMLDWPAFYTPIELVTRLFGSVEPGATNAPVSEMLEVLVPYVPARSVLQHGNELGRLGVAYIETVCGTDQAAWTNLTRLAPEWDGDVSSLAHTSKML